MVTSHVETLIERLTGSSERAKADADGDYPLRYRNAAYFVRVTKPQRPVVQVFSVAVADGDVSDGLVHALNEINSDLSFCRTIWVRDQVLFESEHLGASIGESDFNECVQNVAAASDYFGPPLADRFGGRLLFEESKEPDHQPQNTGVLPMTEVIRDDGPALLDDIQAALQMDDEWTVRSERALT